MHPTKFIELAEKRSNDSGSGPAAYRSAVSRAYYGAYLSVLTFVKAELSLSCKWSKGDSLSEHQVLQRMLMGSQVPEAVKMGQQLSNLHEHRKHADYDLDELAYEDQAESILCVARAAEIMSLLAQCSSSPLRPQLLAGMTQYRRMMQLPMA